LQDDLGVGELLQFDLLVFGFHVAIIPKSGAETIGICNYIRLVFNTLWTTP